jgi:DNA repair protein RadA/Sms
VSLKQKVREQWVCSDCGNEQVKWSGSCPACKNWNTMQRFTESKEPQQRAYGQVVQKPVQLKDVEMQEFDRFSTGFLELDKVLGGGVVLASLVLLGGDPGIGKSTLMLMVASQFCKMGMRVLYVCGEESTQQTSLRAKRLGINDEGLYLYAETLFSNIQEQIETLEPDVFILDSIQIVYKGEVNSLPGSITQVREISVECMHIAKQRGITTFLIGHVTKSGELAGPKVLEHIVDTVLDFEGDLDVGYRLIRAHKNRFGPTDEVAMFRMIAEGLEEVPNPSEIFLQERLKEVTGSAIVPTLEGSRAILVEIQALVGASAFSTSSRKASGIDQNRLALLLAVLEKRMGYHFHSLDVFVSVAGGLKIRETAIDLAIVLAIASSFCNRAIDPLTSIIGEVGLGGEVRSVPRIENRLKEIKQMGFKRCILPKRNLPKEKMDIELIGVERVDQAISYLLA